MFILNFYIRFFTHDTDEHMIPSPQSELRSEVWLWRPFQPHWMRSVMNNLHIDLTGAKILTVDDVPANLDVLSQALETNGYNVLVATI